jgi:undecaprenyl-diphosphatase
VLDLLRAIALGIVQALTEFLPISSSAHLLLVRSWIGLRSVDGLTFDVALHIGTLAALIAYFEKELRALCSGLVQSFRVPRARWTLHHRLPWYILAGTVPAMVVGAILEGSMIEVVRQPVVAVVTLTIGGVLFLVFERLSVKSDAMEDLTLAGCILIGCAQAIALIPGVSRSGITILAGLAVKLKREEAAKFAFLLGGPITFLAAGKDAVDAWQSALTKHEILIFGVGVLTSGAVGWFVIKYLLRFLSHHKLDVFAYYRFVLAAVVLLTMLL